MMRNLVLALAIFGMAGIAHAGTLTGESTLNYLNYPIYSQGNGLTLTAMPLDGVLLEGGPFIPIYSSIGTNDGEFVTGPGGVFLDDYTSVAAGLQNITELRFAGGVSVANGVVFFDFMDTGGNFVDGFGVALPQAGNLLWIISAGGDAFVQAQGAGFMQISVDDGTKGPLTDFTWLFTESPVEIGSNMGTPGNQLGDYATTIYEFELSVPAPGALALLGVAGLIGRRRRRA